MFAMRMRDMNHTKGIKNMTKVLNCTLTSKEVKDKKGKKYTNLYLLTENGTEVQIKLAFFNSKLQYKLVKEIENAK